MDGGLRLGALILQGLSKSDSERREDERDQRNNVRLHSCILRKKSEWKIIEIGNVV
jgi:hypothetical protein